MCDNQLLSQKTFWCPYREMDVIFPHWQADPEKNIS